VAGLCQGGADPVHALIEIQVVGNGKIQPGQCFCTN
jgi:hypothetical protein